MALTGYVYHSRASEGRFCCLLCHPPNCGPTAAAASMYSNPYRNSLRNRDDSNKRLLVIAGRDQDGQAEMDVRGLKNDGFVLKNDGLSLFDDKCITTGPDSQSNRLRRPGTC